MLVFVPVLEDINSKKDEWYVLSGVTNDNGGPLAKQLKLTTATLSASQAKHLCVMARLAVNRYKELLKESLGIKVSETCTAEIEKS